MTRLVSRLAGLVEREFRTVFVEGEISNFKRPRSGHCYFTVKDERAQVRCTMWASDAARLRFRPADGMRVRIRGGLTVYAARGDLQISVRSMQPAGEGALQKALAELARKLDLEGLFDPARKRSLPRFPRCVGVVTSATGAAVRDILTVLKRRYPLARVVVQPVLVQGDGAANDIARAVRSFNRLPGSHPQRPDVLIVGRGGGSLEDLWAFNEEVTVRAVHASGIPVVSGVGHESDSTLVDLVADQRAATPSMAAELAVPDQEELRGTLRAIAARQDGLIRARIQRARALVERARRVPHPGLRIDRARGEVDRRVTRLERSLASLLERAKLQLEARKARLEGMNPLRPLETGFALVEHAGRRIVSARDVPSDEPFRIRFQEGSVSARQVRNGDGDTSFTSADSEGRSLISNAHTK
ncbi:MAG: exodeoxyribonuclease VII large subunit [Rhodothermales bacterium]|nr:exodeoxyribonuclease VII large subunit [Rhodothermales bacterium]MBO6781574.1 exodeoxyribonuclease VII large subunit [Rhodothermales bacterium]